MTSRRILALASCTLLALAATSVSVVVLSAAPLGAHASPALSTPVAPAPPVALESAPVPDLAAATSGLPLRFVANVGQHPSDVRYTVRGAGHSLFFTPRGVVFSTGALQDGEVVHSVVRLSFAGADPNPAIRAFAPLSGVINYFRGGDPVRWRANVSTYEGLVVEGLYPGIDLIYQGAGGELKSEFVVAPGADPDAIVLVYSGVQDVRLRDDGALVLVTPLGELIERAPWIYQRTENGVETIIGSYVRLGARRVGFRVGSYDPQRPLIIDPTIEFSSYLGGSDDHDYAEDVVFGDDGAIYVTGRTWSDDFPTVSPVPGLGQQPGSADVFVTKLVQNAGSYEYAYSTYLGGSSTDEGYGIAATEEGDVWITGLTQSTDFPTTTNAIQPAYADTGGSNDAFVTHIVSASGAYTLGFSSFLGGYRDDQGMSIAVDAAGDAYLTGRTASSDFPTTTNAIQPVFTGTEGYHTDAFVVKVDGTDFSLEYSSFLGGSVDDGAYAIDLDDAGNIYVGGFAWSTDFPTTTNAFDRNMPIYGKAFVAKIVQSGGTYSYGYSTLVGSNSGGDEVHGLAVHGDGDVFVTGYTNGTWSLVRPIQSSKGSLEDAFVARIAQVAGTPVLSYSTYLGGDGDDRGSSIAVDGNGDVYVAGYTWSANFPRRNAIQSTRSGLGDGFVAKIVDPGAGTPYLAYSTYLGGTGYDYANGIAAGADGTVAVAGQSQGGFPMRDPVDLSVGGVYDAFVCTIADFGDLAIAKGVTPPGAVGRGARITYTLTFSNGGSGTVGGVTLVDSIPPTLTQVTVAHAGALVTPTTAFSYTWQVSDLGPGEGGVITVTGVVSPGASGTFTLTNMATITSTQSWWTDDFGNNNASVVETLVKADPPPTPALISPGHGAAISETTSLLAWAVSAGASGYLLDWNGAVSDVGNVTTRTTPLLADGTYTWTVAAYDSVGNVSPFTPAWALTIDTTAPQPPVLRGPGDGTSTANATPTLAWEASAGAAGYLVDWRGAIADVGPATAYTVTPAVAEGVYTWTVAAYDALRNTSAFTEVWSFTVGELVAGLAANSSSPTRQGTPTAFTATVSAGSSVAYDWSYGDGAAGTGATTVHTYAMAGQYTAVVTASNVLNAVSATTVVTVFDYLDLSGGVVITTSDGALAIAAPAVLSGTLAITYTPVMSPSAGTGALSFGGLGFTLAAVDGVGQPVTVFSPPLTMSVFYDDAALAPGVDEESLDVYRYDVAAGEWITLTTLARYPLTDTLLAALDHLTEFALLGRGGWKVFVPTVLRP